MRRFLIIPHLKIQNANAMSSPYTIGFPAMTAWLGAVHFLQRHIQQLGFSKVTLTSVAISCHQLDLQTYKGQGDFVYSIIGTANPLEKDGSRASFIEEARCHLDVTLLIEYNGLDSDDLDDFLMSARESILAMKFASGDVLSFMDLESKVINEDDEQAIKMVSRKLMPGYVLLERRDLMIEALKNEEKDALDVLLDYIDIKHRSFQDIDGVVRWTMTRKAMGWLVPIATGFQGISDLGFAKYQRDTTTPHRFAESIVTLGEFVMPYRIKELDKMLWHYQFESEHNLYLCKSICN